MFVANVWLKEVGSVWGKLEHLVEKWLKHHELSVKLFKPLGLLGAGLFAIPGHPEWAIELAYWRTKEDFKKAQGTQEWKDMVADLYNNTWGGTKDTWPKDQLPPNLELLAGDPIPEDALALPIWASA